MVTRWLGVAAWGAFVLFGTQQLLTARQNQTGPAGAGPQDRHSDPLPAGATARLGSTRLRHAGAVRCLAFAGDILVSAGDDGWTHRWEGPTGKRLASFRSPVAVLGAAVTEAPAALSPDGRLLAVVSEAGDKTDTVILWQTADGTSLAFTTDGRTLVAAHADGTVLFWDLSDRVAKKAP